MTFYITYIDIKIRTRHHRYRNSIKFLSFDKCKIPFHIIVLILSLLIKNICIYINNKKIEIVIEISMTPMYFYFSVSPFAQYISWAFLHLCKRFLLFYIPIRRIVLCVWDSGNNFIWKIRERYDRYRGNLIHWCTVVLICGIFYLPLSPPPLSLSLSLSLRTLCVRELSWGRW